MGEWEDRMGAGEQTFYSWVLPEVGHRAGTQIDGAAVVTGGLHQMMLY